MRLLWVALAGHIGYLLFCRWFFPPITLTQLHSVVKGHGMVRHYVRLEAIAPEARLAVIAAEDQRFAEHHGFDWTSIRQALEWNRRHPDRLRGASTISQQVAKNVFLWQGRDWFRKALEVYFTIWVELLYDKRRILELYLNVVEMGKGLFGIEAAAQRYFGKSARELTASEAAQIASALPNPKHYVVQPPSPWVRHRSKGVFSKWSNWRVTNASCCYCIENASATIGQTKSDEFARRHVAYRLSNRFRWPGAGAVQGSGS